MMAKRTPLLSPHLVFRTGSEKVNAANIRKALAKSLVISSQKSSDCHPRTSFFTGTMPQSTLLPQSRSSNGNRCVKTICHHFIHQISPPANLFPIPKSKVGAGWPLIVPGRLTDELGRGCPNHYQRRYPRNLLAVV